MSYIPRHIPFEKKLKLLWDRVRDQLHKPYRIALMDFETFSESRQYVFKPLTLLLAGLLGFTVLVGGTACLIIFTPLREYIPGYFRPEYTQDINVLKAELDELKKAVQNQEAVMPALQPLSDKNTQQGNAQEAISAVQSNVESEPAQAQPTGQSSATPSRAASAPVAFSAVKALNSNALLTLYPPVPGTLSRSFGPAMRHFGADLVAPENTLVQSAIDGVVVFADFSDRDGYIIAVAGANNIVTFYKHNSRVLKSVGNYVQAGDPIAIIGNSGENTTGTHLHFELWVAGKPVDPSPYLH